MGEATTVERARRAAERGDWAEAYESLTDCDEALLSPQDLEALADAAWWLSRVEESLSARQKAYSGYVAEGNERRAGYNAWMLSSEYHVIGKPAASMGWLKKAQRHLHNEPECVERGFLAYGEAEVAAAEGDLDKALAFAQQMIDIGRRCESPDLVAMGMQTQGRLLIAKGQVSEGMAQVDEAMCDVVAGRLSDLITGWLYCLGVATYFDMADLRRATEWNDAAMAWCESFPTGTPFHGICRVHHVELIGLGGAWHRANAEADRACEELMAYHPNMAAESFYVAGEIRRRMGDLSGAEEAFVRAHELGREPQPGLALVRLAQGRPEAAAVALRSCLAGGSWNPLARARLLAAMVEVALAAGDLQLAREAADELAELSNAPDAALLEAMAATAEGSVQLAEGAATDALKHLRRGRALWMELGMPYEAAQARVLLAAASRMVGDNESAHLELRAARSVFERLGSAADIQKVDELLEPHDQLPASLTQREAEILRLVAAGNTNRHIAGELVISEHTVARHLNNIFAKLGVSSRAAATAFAYTHDLV